MTSWTLKGQKYIVRLSVWYDGPSGTTTAQAQRVYGGGIVLDCGMGSVRGRDEAGAIKALRESRHAVKDVAAIAEWRRNRRAS